MSDEAQAAVAASTQDAPEAPGPSEVQAPIGHQADAPDASQANVGTQAPVPKASARAEALRKERLENQRMRQELEQLRSQVRPVAGDRQGPRSFNEEELRLAYKRDPLRFISEFGGEQGLAYANQFYINGGKPPPEVQVELMRHEVSAETRRLQQELATRDQQLQLRDHRATVQAELARIAVDDRYENLMTLTDDPAREVQDLIIADFERQQREGSKAPRAKSIEQAAQLIEDHIDRLIAEQVSQWRRSKKASRHLTPAEQRLVEAAERAEAKDDAYVDPEIEFNKGLAAAIDKRAPAKSSPPASASKGISTRDRQQGVPINKNLSRSELAQLLVRSMDGSKS